MLRVLAPLVVAVLLLAACDEEDTPAPAPAQAADTETGPRGPALSQRCAAVRRQIDRPRIPKERPGESDADFARRMAPAIASGRRLYHELYVELKTLPRPEGDRRLAQYVSAAARVAAKYEFATSLLRSGDLFTAVGILDQARGDQQRMRDIAKDLGAADCAL
jgi:hypothetical protein